MAWFYLLLAGLFEIVFATLLKQSQGFTRLWPSIGFVAAGATSFYLLTQALRTLPVGTAYAVWTGIGAFGTAIVGILFFKEPATAARLALLIVLVGAIIGLKLVSPE